jgi:hypothetical protein
MGLSSILGGPLFDVIGKVIDRAIPDPVEKGKLQVELTKIADQAAAREHEELMGQIEVNKTEAAHKSIFVAGWRPFIGWTAGAGVAWSFVVAPISEWVSRLIGWTGKMPELDSAQLMTLVLALLGMGGLRTYEKMKGVAREESPIETNSQPPAATPAPAPKKKGFDLWPF